MTLKRLLLLVLTLISVGPALLSLGGSLNQPQIQARLQLYQTNLVLAATEFTGFDDTDPVEAESLRNALLGTEPYTTAIAQFKEAETQAVQTREQLQAQLERQFDDSVEDGSTLAAEVVSQATIAQTETTLTETTEFIAQTQVLIGLLQTQTDEPTQAFQNWEQAGQNPRNSSIAQTLQALWSEPAQPVADAELTIKNGLDGWFEWLALRKLFVVEGNDVALSQLNLQIREQASEAVIKLGLIGGLPFFAGLLGVGILIFLLGQRLVKKNDAILATNSSTPWDTPWDWETVWQVLVVGFFLISQLVLPLAIGLLGINPSGGSIRFQALYVLGCYLGVAIAGLGVLLASIQQYQPLPPDWFKFQFLGNWLGWGIAGYLVAVPVVVLVSLINQQLWQGQGGSNPLLLLALQAQDRWALLIFFLTAAIAAPIFEEIMFRGFLLPSLTRYVPVWAAIVLSSLVFSFAHLSLAEVLPLTALGVVLGIVYTRSRNLLASMLVHSLWNSGTLLSLFILGSQ
ncbi:MAG: type II CAAX endopeptidase family protein [Cyanobacteria bacterium P01_H01_bin.15]